MNTSDDPTREVLKGIAGVWELDYGHDKETARIDELGNYFWRSPDGTEIRAFTLKVAAFDRLSRKMRLSKFCMKNAVVLKRLRCSAGQLYSTEELDVSLRWDHMHGTADKGNRLWYDRTSPVESSLDDLQVKPNRVSDSPTVSSSESSRLPAASVSQSVNVIVQHAPNVAGHSPPQQTASRHESVSWWSWLSEKTASTRENFALVYYVLSVAAILGTIFGISWLSGLGHHGRPEAVHPSASERPQTSAQADGAGPETSPATMEQFFQEFSGEEATPYLVLKRYVGKRVTWEGYFNSPGGTDSFALFRDPDLNGPFILCYFNEDGQADMLALRKGYKVRVTGIVKSHPTLEGCKILAIEPGRKPKNSSSTAKPTG